MPLQENQTFIAFARSQATAWKETEWQLESLTEISLSKPLLSFRHMCTYVYSACLIAHIVSLGLVPVHMYV